VIFARTSDARIAQYWIEIGRSSDGPWGYSSDFSDSSVLTMSNMPTDGLAFHVRLWSLLDGQWWYRDYRFIAAGTAVWNASSRESANANGDCWNQATAAGFAYPFKSWLCVEDDYETVTVVGWDDRQFGLHVQRSFGGSYILHTVNRCDIPWNARVVVHSPNGFGGIGSSIPAYGCHVSYTTSY